jgi:hypothetical protein
MTIITVRLPGAVQQKEAGYFFLDKGLGAKQGYSLKGK